MRIIFLTERLETNMTNEIATNTTTLDLVMSADVERVSQQLQAIDNFQMVVQKTLRPEQDFGTIPGTNKPTLLKPGAEKILMLMGLTSEYEIIDKVEDYAGGFFAYTVKSSLLKNGQLITEGFGSANTKENRYRLNEWSEEEHKKVWTGGYQDPYTLVNTVLKMAKKRAQVDAALTVGSLSNVFTQDMEDMKDFADKERMETMNGKDASSVKVTFGKNKGRTLGEIMKDDQSYVEWIAKNAKDDYMKKAANEILNESKKPKGDNQKPKPKEQTATNDQMDEIELMLDIISQGENLTIDQWLDLNPSLKNYKLYNKPQAERFVEYLKKLIPQKEETQKDVAQNGLFDDMNPPLQGTPYHGETPFD